MSQLLLLSVFGNAVVSSETSMSVGLILSLVSVAVVITTFIINNVKSRRQDDIKALDAARLADKTQLELQIKTVENSTKTAINELETSTKNLNSTISKLEKSVLQQNADTKLLIAGLDNQYKMLSTTLTQANETNKMIMKELNNMSQQNSVTATKLQKIEIQHEINHKQHIGLTT